MRKYLFIAAIALFSVPVMAEEPTNDAASRTTVDALLEEEIAIHDKIEPEVSKSVGVEPAAEAVKSAVSEKIQPNNAEPVKAEAEKPIVKEPKPAKPEAVAAEPAPAKTEAVKPVADEKKAGSIKQVPEIKAEKTVAKAAPEQLKTMGWIEKIAIMPDKAELDAKLDTGAKTSSIRSDIDSLYTKDNEEWVKFTIIDLPEPVKQYDRKITRWAEIKDMNGGRQLRPVVEMTFCVGDEAVTGEVTLAPRPDFNQPVLVGRNMLNKRVIVDVSQSYRNKPVCQ